MSEDDEMPPPEAIWVALALVTWAIAIALAPTVRGRFIQALANLAAEHEARGRFITFSPPSRRASNLPRATRLAVAWVRSILSELRAARG